MSWLAPHRLVDDHFAGRATAGADRRMWRHLPGCDRCRARYRALSLLESLEPDAEARAQRRVARAVFAPAPPRRALLGMSLAVAAAAVVLLVVLPRERGRFASRGVEAPSSPAVPAPALTIFRVPAAGAGAAGPERVASVIRAGDSLAFSYLNPPGTGAAYLLVFAVDEGGRVYWFWPAWTAAAADPPALPIGAAATPVELAEAVRHPLRPGHLTVHALFARRPYHVREVEAAVQAGKLGETGALDGVLVTQPVEVLP